MNTTTTADGEEEDEEKEDAVAPKLSRAASKAAPCGSEAREAGSNWRLSIPKRFGRSRAGVSSGQSTSSARRFQRPVCSREVGG